MIMDWDFSTFVYESAHTTVAFWVTLLSGRSLPIAAMPRCPMTLVGGRARPWLAGGGNTLGTFLVIVLVVIKATPFSVRPHLSSKVGINKLLQIDLSDTICFGVFGIAWRQSHQGISLVPGTGNIRFGFCLMQGTYCLTDSDCNEMSILSETFLAASVLQRLHDYTGTICIVLVLYPQCYEVSTTMPQWPLGSLGPPHELALLQQHLENRIS
jgi:hypothetical protein